MVRFFQNQESKVVMRRMAKMKKEAHMGTKVFMETLGLKKIQL